MYKFIFLHVFLYCVLHDRDRAVASERTAVIVILALLLVKNCSYICKHVVNSLLSKDMCMAVYTKEKAAKSRTPVLELLIKVVF